jgi:hypothetical protein
MKVEDFLKNGKEK